MSAQQDLNLKITRYLDRLLAQGSLRLMTVDKAMIEVRTWIPQSGQLSDADLRSLVLGYYLSHYVYLPAEAELLSPTGRAKELIDAVKKALAHVIEGVPIVDTLGGKITIGVKGLTAKMKGSGPETSLNVSWTGTLSAVVSGGNFTLTNTLSQQGWSIGLSYPKDAPVLDAARVGQVFGEAGKAVSGIIESTFALTDVKDVRSVLDRISPVIGPVADAMGAAQGIAARPKKGLSVSISVGSPPPLPGQSGIRGGVHGFVTLTYAW